MLNVDPTQLVLALTASVTLVEVLLGAFFVLWLAPNRGKRLSLRVFRETVLPDLENALEAKLKEALDAALGRLERTFEEKLKLVIQAADERIAAAQEQMHSALLAAQQASQPDGTATASQMGTRSAEVKKEYRLKEEALEAFIRHHKPGLGAVLIPVAKRFVPDHWKDAVKTGPEGLPALWDAVKGFMPGSASSAPAQAPGGGPLSWGR